MSGEKEKIEGIVMALLANSLNSKASKIGVNVERDDISTTITVEDNGRGMNDKTIKIVKTTLNQPRRDEVEEYYGCLAGNCNCGSGLTIVGMLVDEAQVESKENEGTKIIVRRNKDYDIK